jgi:hypothetical protein
MKAILDTSVLIARNVPELSGELAISAASLLSDEVLPAGSV